MTAASLWHMLLMLFPTLLGSSYGAEVPLQTLCTRGPPEEDPSTSLPFSPYENKPWNSLDSGEYLNGYGSHHVWADYFLNHKAGGTMDQTGIPNNQVSGNPCPVCKYLKLHVDFRDVKLLEQFVCAHRRIIFHAPYPGVYEATQEADPGHPESQ